MPPCLEIGCGPVDVARLMSGMHDRSTGDKRCKNCTEKTLQFESQLCSREQMGSRPCQLVMKPLILGSEGKFCENLVWCRFGFMKPAHAFRCRSLRGSGGGMSTATKGFFEPPAEATLGMA